MEQFLSPAEAHGTYDLVVNEVAPQSAMEQVLAREGIAAIEIPLALNDFARLSEGYAVCLEACPDILAQTTGLVDSRFGGDVGHVRKVKKIDPQTGLQVSDPKNLFHFNERVRESWRERFAHGPQILRNFLADGFEIQDSLIGVAEREIARLESTHPNISHLYFRDRYDNPTSHTFMRLLRYDGYQVTGNLQAVAKPHYDIGGVTLQAYADAEGFWGMPDRSAGKVTHFDTREGKGYLFLGKGHEKVYGKTDALKPLWHGVDRVIPAGVTYVPERTAVILFVDAPAIDYDVTSRDTVPYAFGK
ncbi:MAG TPA: hypothetical protein VMB52_05975 [Verrucomicrobiae bacterium]|nr:hypothetical protein [Verrucomicrobiae bacterium]